MSTDSTRNLYGLDRESLAIFLSRYDVPEFHAGQVYRWMYQRDVLSPQRWTDLPRTLRARLIEDVTVDAGTLGRRTGAEDETIKYRTGLAGGGEVETVYMRQSDRVTLCVSSQIGCALDCDFCLTGKMGFKRHLTPGEIVGQVALIRRDRALDGPFNIVFMGMGEPLHNYDSTIAAVRLLCDPEGFGLSRRRVTVSTVGMAPAIEKLAEEPIRPRLAISLNATTDEVRSKLMPITGKYGIERVLEAAVRFRERTKDAFTLEYVLLSGINDTDSDAARLADIARRARAKVNLIPFNPVPGWLTYRPPSRARTEAIRDRLSDRGTRVSIRWSRGAQARAACGQLALLPDTPGEAPMEVSG
ncbi:MAG: 23S rRNA (adenine(2503)-C(2))-methyltransferase RlmN [Acidobacteria bacterium]|nr:23S rRNA (adenine(2503)-C(2))-methyltransferase RlmN [Acidobacteriota bacterium]NIM62950.1 23S rRNA (adenine(2503)-C(2))-methyltransferase RlmN [Acidobacteriota bacterium]NIO60632.1 23S rRNA (adenine(2503)-C(2))-methyltransferase RlmN [Acidobacteriota bacterium]NIQ31723.1 23S rRNA (adenine(2503)-C(2))-methyltransferase RlmN [Acidobacteriota bacterium]NIQ86993.1 23S rRNA (adenine(2503)-C(2))-methyltransferase RlmN [Acidobacteriota bacterium]